MIKILAVLLLAIAGFYLGYKLYKSNKEDDQTVSMYATLTMICALVGGIVLISYLLLKGSPWTGENKVLMRYILVFCLALSFIYLGGKLIIRGRKGDDRLTQIAGLSWVLVTLLASGYAISYVSKMNEGWTPEKQKVLMNNCIKQNDSKSLDVSAIMNIARDTNQSDDIIQNSIYDFVGASFYDCPCFVKEVMKKYQNDEEYHLALEKEGGEEKFYASMDTLCQCGGKSYSKEEIEVVSGIPDDF